MRGMNTYGLEQKRGTYVFLTRSGEERLGLGVHPVLLQALRTMENTREAYGS